MLILLLASRLKAGLTEDSPEVTIVGGFDQGFLLSQGSPVVPSTGIGGTREALSGYTCCLLETKDGGGYLG